MTLPRPVTMPRPIPRPQLVRPNWMNLNGTWEFAFDPGRSGLDRGLPAAESLPGEIVVPFCPESPLSGIGDADFHPGVWYRRTFTVPEDWDGRRVLLHFGAVDYDACRVGQRSCGGPPSWRVHALLVRYHRPALHRGENVVVVNAQDDSRDPLIPAGKQCPDYYSRRCHYTRTTGIWQTVWLEPVPDSYIQRLTITPQLEAGPGDRRRRERRAPAQGTLELEAALAGKRVGQVQLAVYGTHAAVTLPLSAVEAWGPGNPTLYDLTLTLDVRGRRAGRGRSPTLACAPWASRERAILLNGQPFYPAAGAGPGLLPRRHLYRARRRGPAPRHRARAWGWALTAPACTRRCSSRASSTGPIGWATWCGTSSPVGAWT